MPILGMLQGTVAALAPGIGNGMVLLGLEATVQVRSFFQLCRVVLVWFVHQTQQKAENSLRQGKSRKQTGLGAGNKFWPEEEAVAL